MSNGSGLPFASTSIDRTLRCADLVGRGHHWRFEGELMIGPTGAVRVRYRLPQGRGRARSAGARSHAGRSLRWRDLCVPGQTGRPYLITRHGHISTLLERADATCCVAVSEIHGLKTQPSCGPAKKHSAIVDV